MPKLLSLRDVHKSRLGNEGRVHIQVKSRYCKQVELLLYYIIFNELVTTSKQLLVPCRRNFRIKETPHQTYDIRSTDGNFIFFCEMGKPGRALMDPCNSLVSLLLLVGSTRIPAFGVSLLDDASQHRRLVRHTAVYCT